MGKHKGSKGLDFLHTPHSSISCEIEAHAIQKTGENCILNVRETYGKIQKFQSYGFFLHISCEALIHTIPKIWEKWIPIERENNGKAQTFQS